jgi:hypothetical protein
VRYASPNAVCANKIIRAENGGEFIKDQMQKTWEAEGIRLELTIAYAHNQNGVTERANQDILTHAISILDESHLPKELWFEICLTVAYLKNLWPHSHLKYKTPYEVYTGRKPNLSHLRVIGSKAHILVPKEVREHKFKSRSVLGRLLGYEGSNQYRLWAEETNKIVWARDVQLEEYNEIYSEARSHDDDDVSGTLILDPDLTNAQTDASIDLDNTNSTDRQTIPSAIPPTIPSAIPPTIPSAIPPTIPSAILLWNCRIV